MKKLVPLVLAAVLATGCYTTKYYYAGEQGRGVDHKTYANSLFWGLITLNEVNLEGYCPDTGIARIKSQITGLGLILNWCTGGIYTPITVTITCGNK